MAPSIFFYSSIPLSSEFRGGGEIAAREFLVKCRRAKFNVELAYNTDPGIPLNPARYFLRSIRDFRPFWRLEASRDNTFEFPETRLSGSFRQISDFIHERMKNASSGAYFGHLYRDWDLRLAMELAGKSSASFLFIHVCCYIEILRHFGKLPENLYLIAPSPFVKELVYQKTGRSAFINLPLPEPAKVIAHISEREYITFINPVPEKGLQVVERLIQYFPKEKFLIVNGAWSSKVYRRTLPENIARYGNVEIWGFQDDVRGIYAKTKILLCPSRVPESFSRTVFEANLNGIPVVASGLGSLPYTLGGGGIIVKPHDSVDGYRAAIQSLCGSRDFYEEISQKAYENAKRGDFCPKGQFDRLLNFIKEKSDA